MNHALSRYLRRLAIAGLAVTLVGCAGSRDFAQHKQDADARWWNLRGSMILEQAEHHFENSDLDQAQATLREAMRISPDNPNLLILAGRIALERGELERAAISLKSAAEAAPEDAVAPYYLGIVYQRWQRPEPARDQYAKAAQLDPDNLEYLLALAEAEVALGHDEQAVTLMEQRLDYFGNNAALHNALGQALILVERPVEAIHHLRNAAVLEPGNQIYQSEFATQLLEHGQPEPALKILTALLKDAKNSDRIDLRRARARASEELGRWAEARREYRALTRTDEPDPQDLLGLARTSWQLDDTHGAEHAAARIIEAQPSNTNAMIWLGLAALSHDEPLQASRWLRNVTAHKPDDAQAWALYGTSLQQLGQREAALQAYQRARQIEPDNPRFRQLVTQNTTKPEPAS